jgi:hypothetical protein
MSDAEPDVAVVAGNMRDYTGLTAGHAVGMVASNIPFCGSEYNG